MCVYEAIFFFETQTMTAIIKQVRCTLKRTLHMCADFFFCAIAFRYSERAFVVVTYYIRCKSLFVFFVFAQMVTKLHWWGGGNGIIFFCRSARLEMFFAESFGHHGFRHPVILETGKKSLFGKKSHGKMVLFFVAARVWKRFYAESFGHQWCRHPVI